MSWLLSLLFLCSSFAILGSLVGGIAGLVPGLHPNTIAAVFASFPQLFAFSTIQFGAGQPESIGAVAILIACFLVGVLIGHSITEIIPTAMLGVSNDDTIVAQLPSQRLYALGRADLAIEATVVGGIGSVALAALLFLPTRFLMGSPLGLYSSLRPIMGLILLGISTLVISRSGGVKKVLLAVATYLSSGALGIFVLSMQIPTQITHSFFGDLWAGDASSFLLPAFSGFFAVPALILSSERAKGSQAPQTQAGGRPKVSLARSIAGSAIPSLLVGWMPGITNAYAASLARSRRKSDSESVESSYRYLITYSATNVGGSLQSIIALATIFRARNGTLEAVNDHFSFGALSWFDPLQPPIVILSLFWAACIASVVGALLCKHLGPRILCRPRGRPLRFLRPCVLLLIASIVVWTSGPVGLLLMASSSLLGMSALLRGAPRIHLMGFLLLPVTIFFFTPIGP
jgi:putative membrane protein